MVLPVLGALPDALIVGVAGLGGGPREEVQHELAVGIGTLAGSTVCPLHILRPSMEAVQRDLAAGVGTR